jgi:hypothetical protein
MANLAEPTPETQGLFTTLIQAISVVYTVGYLALLAALLTGLPSVEPIEDEDEDADEDGTEADWATGADAPTDEDDGPAGDDVVALT